MTHMCLKPVEQENVQNDLGIKLIIDEMLTSPKRIIYGHIKRFLDAGGSLQALSLSNRKDGTLILRTDDRTVITVHIQIDGRKFIDKAFEAPVEVDTCL